MTKDKFWFLNEHFDDFTFASLIDEKCHFKPNKAAPHIPKFKFPSKYKTSYECLKDYCFLGLKKKLGNFSKEYENRLKYELKIIKKKKLSDWFLIISDLVNHSEKKGHLIGPGRGSSSGSLICFSLGITKVDPIKHTLLFERFYNYKYEIMPDIYLDFPAGFYNKAIDYLKKKYGSKNVTKTISFGRINAEIAILKTGYTLGLSYDKLNKINRMFNRDANLRWEMENNKKLKKVIAKKPSLKTLFSIASQIQNGIHSTGRHAAKILIHNTPNLIPISIKNRFKEPICLYDKKTLNKLGFFTIDILGFGTLDIINKTVKLIRTKEKNFDIYKIPLDDNKTFKLLSLGNTNGVFQFESAGMRELIKKLKPSKFSDISVLLALYRPGPIQSGMPDEFIERKHGKKKIVYDHPLLRPILEETYGVLVYQEQVMKIAKAMGDFSPGDADYLRKALGKKTPEVMDKFKRQFLEGAKKKKVPVKIATIIFDQIVQFGAYSFNKSHVVAYGLISYQTAYLKANYPKEFTQATKFVKKINNKGM
ncbi:MAG: DNA polymerase III subunit alpha [Elusimicrobia bacterium]|nr:DNA polymerase III subunit alpha [Elusimicrobiota bacterium]